MAPEGPHSAIGFERSVLGTGFPRPGLSASPANRLPIMATLAPAAIALVRSPEKRIPPSATMGMLAAFRRHPPPQKSP